MHSRSGGTADLAQSLIAGTQLDGIDGVVVDVSSPAEVDADSFRAADAVIIATPEHFGAMAGLVKDCFERVYETIIDETRSMPFALVVKGRHDGSGTVRGLTAITTGLGWNQVRPPLVVIGDVTHADREAAMETGATVAAGLASGLWSRRR